MSELLRRAKLQESNGNLDDAFTLYKEALDVFVQQRRSTTDPVKTRELMRIIDENLTHTENLKAKIAEKKAREKMTRTVRIEQDSTGHDLCTLFQPYLSDCSRVILSDPYLGAPHQVRLLHAFCELLYKNNVIMLIIETSPDSTNSEELKQLVSAFGSFLKIYLVTSAILHDREITFHERPAAGQGKWVARLGRGLDIYQKVDKYAPGWHDYGLRPCRECVIEVFYKHFDLQEFNELKHLLHKIKDISTQAKQIYTENMHKPGVETLLTHQIEKLDNLQIPSHLRYAKAVKKEAINTINSYSSQH